MEYNKKDINLPNSDIDLSNDINNICDDIYNNISEYTIIIPKNNYYCINCNKRGHTFKKCYEPIISNGLISVFIENFDLNLLSKLEQYVNNNIKKKVQIKTNYTNYEKYYNKIKFLMVQRKHSLGYIEFMRGRYNINDIKSIKYLIEQMSPIEIKNIMENDFDLLWNSLWNNKDTTNKKHYKEYMSSKEKFGILKKQGNINIFFTLPKYVLLEWGFPKGRREMYESDLICAMREFEEETNYNEDEYYVLNENYAVRENLVGTNGVNYRHNYYLAILYNNTIKSYNNNEIGDIKIMNIDECLSVIRPYHYNKISIIKKIFDLILNFLYLTNQDKNEYLTMAV